MLIYQRVVISHRDFMEFNGDVKGDVAIGEHDDWVYLKVGTPKGPISIGHMMTNDWIQGYPSLRPTQTQHD